MNMIHQLFQRSWLWRWTCTALYLFRRVRIHPTARLMGQLRGLQLAAGVKIGAGSQVDVGNSGLCVIDELVWISTDVEIQTVTEVRIGRGTTIQRRCTINGSTRIGDECILAPNVFMSSGTHPFRSFPELSIRMQERRLAELAGAGAPDLDRPVWIQDDCWLGVNVVVCPGVTIGKGCVIGANSVVTKSIAPYTVAAGSPARPIGQRLAWSPPMQLDTTLFSADPYLLAGGRRKGIASGAAGPLTPTPEVLCRAALRASAPAAIVRIHYRALRKVQLSVPDGVHDLPIGDGFLDISGTDAEMTGVVYCDFRMRGAALGDLQIYRLQAV